MKCSNLVAVALSTALAACSGTPQPRDAAATSACEDLGNASAALTAFYEPGTVYAAQKAERDAFIGRASVPKHTVGAELSMHAQPGMDEAYLQRVLSCHAVAGRPLHPSDPLVPDSGQIASVTVDSSGDSLTVRVTGRDRATSEEIWRRAQAFATGSGSVRVEQVASAGHTPRF